MGQFAYTPYVWPMLAPAAFSLVVAVYAWRRRRVPGALPVSLLLLGLCGWAVSVALELAAIDEPTRVFWFKVEGAWQVPSATVAVWLALEYTGLDRYLGAGVLALLATPPIVALAVIVATPETQLVWQHGGADPGFSPLPPFFVGYGVLLAAASSAAFVWLLVWSPLHRRPAALVLCGHAGLLLGYLLDTVHAGPLGPLDTTVLGMILLAWTYALAVFRFRMLLELPIARGTVVRQMDEGLIVLDARDRVLDLNPAAERILGVHARAARGRSACDVVPCPDPAHLEDGSQLDGGGALPAEIRIGTGPAVRWYTLSTSKLEHRRGFRLGTLVLLHDVTEQKEANARLLEHQRALATLRERDQLARELHDGLGQVLGFVKLQAQAARTWLARGDTDRAERSIAELLKVANDAHGDVHDYLLAAGAPSEPVVLESLGSYVRKFGDQHGISTFLEVDPALADEDFAPMVASQLLRMVQEALANVRKHAAARTVRVHLAPCEGGAEAVIEDDGVGFDTGVDTVKQRTYGLRFMRERAREVGGSVRIGSATGRGTRIVIRVPTKAPRVSAGMQT